MITVSARNGILYLKQGADILNLLPVDAEQLSIDIMRAAAACLRAHHPLADASQPETKTQSPVPGDAGSQDRNPLT